MLRSLCLVFFTLLLTLTGLAHAAPVNFNGGTVSNCPRSGTTYDCSAAFIGADDTAIIASGYTVVVNGSIQLAWAQGLQMSGSARLEATGSINLIASNNLNISGGTIKAGGDYLIGGNNSNTTANIIAATVSNNGQAHTLRGSVTATGNVSFPTGMNVTGAVSGGALSTGSNNTIGGALTIVGAINLGGTTKIGGAVSGASIITGSNNSIGGTLVITNSINLGSSTAVTGAVSGASVVAGADATFGSTLTITGAIDLASRVIVNGAVSGDSIVTNSDVKLRDTLTIKKTINLSSGNTVSGDVSGASITTGSGTTINGKLAIVGAINLSSSNTVAGAVTGTSIKTDSGTALNGSVKVDGLADLGSAIKVSGGLSANEVKTISPAQISGGIKANTTITIASGSTISGDITAPTVTLDDSSSTVTGNINASTQLTLGSSSRVTGDVVAGRVITKSSATIDGNAAVNYIYIDGNAAVSKVITCTGSTPGPGAAPCTCVEKPSWYNYQPTCRAAPASSGAHHFQITHTGSALTCQPQTVKVTACANANCTAPHFTGSSTVTLQPGGKSFTFTGEIPTATVEQTSVGSARLGTGATSTTCVNTGNASAPDQCLMSFEDTGLQVSVDNHIAMTDANVKIQALTASADKQSCVPLLKDKQVNVNLSCAFVDPVPSKARSDAIVSINSKNFSCGSSVTSVPFTFNSDGLATTTLTYQEVGQVALSAVYTGTTSSGGGSFSARGTGNFIAAPARFVIESTNPNKSLKISSGSDITNIFALAGEDFNLRAWAVNKDGILTTNFGSEKTAHNIQVDGAVTNPADAANDGTITRGAAATLSKGEWNSSAWRFNDVGTITLTATLLGNNGNYLGYAAPNEGFKTKGEQKVGRFIPAYFQTALPGVAKQGEGLTPGQVPFGTAIGLLMPCRSSDSAPQLLSPCAQGFIYSGQPFYVVVKAFNVANALTLNYKGSLVRNIELSAMTANGGTTALASGAMPVGTHPFGFNQGVGLTAILPAFNFSTAPSARTGTNPTQFFLRATDKDKVSSLRSTASDSIEQAVTAVSGRLLMPNVYGSPTSAMPVTVQAQFYDGTRGGFLFNPFYNAPASTLKISYSNCQKSLAVSNTNNCIAAATLQLLAPGASAFEKGKVSFRLQPPTPRQSGAGSVTITLKSSESPPIEWINYLPSTTGTATFGIYRSGPVIYTREVY